MKPLRPFIALLVVAQLHYSVAPKLFAVVTAFQDPAPASPAAGEQADYAAREAAAPEAAEFEGGDVVTGGIIAAVVVLLLIWLLRSGGYGVDSSDSGESRCAVCSGTGYVKDHNSGQMEGCHYCNGRGYK